MEFIVFLIGLGLFVAYRRFLVLIGGIAAALLTAVYVPRVPAIDALGDVWWLTTAYGIIVVILVFAGLAGVYHRLNGSRPQK